MNALRFTFSGICAVALGIVMGLSSCKQSGKAGGGSAGDTKEIRIGVIQPLSGDLAQYGSTTVTGIKLRVEEINAAGGIDGKKIVLMIEDNKGKGDNSINAFGKLERDGVVAVIAPVTSGNSLKIKEAVFLKKVPSISPTATNDSVTPDNPYFFRTIFNDSFQGSVVGNFMIKELKLNKAAILKDVSSDYSKGLSDNFSKAVRANGGKIVAEENYQPKATNFNGQLKKIKESGAEALFIPGYPPDVQNIIKQVKILGLNVVLLGADGWDNDSIIKGSGDRISGSFIVGAFASDDSRPIVQEFVKKIKAKQSQDPGMFEALGYDTVSLLAEALKKGADRESVRVGLAAIKDFPAVTGNITIDKDGNAVKSAAILEIVKTDGRIVKKYKTTVKP